MRYTDIVVGIDGSGTSRTALRWAVAEARLRVAHLKILAAYSWTRPPDEFDDLSELPEYLGQRFEEMAADTVAEARTLAPGVEVTGGAVLGDPASALLEAGRTAAMVVVGNRGHGGFAGLLLGSVSQQVATHAAVPVVVVRGRADAPPGPIIVGVDGSPSAQDALELGFEEAQRRDCELVAVRSYPVPIPPRGGDVPPLLYDQDAVHAAAADELNAALTSWRDKYPTVPARAVIGPGSPAKNLVELSSEAGLLIVGSRGHGALVGSLLGSVGLQLLHHADCPVMIIHSEPAT